MMAAAAAVAAMVSEGFFALGGDGSFGGVGLTAGILWSE